MVNWRNSYDKTNGTYEIFPYTSPYHEKDLWEALKAEQSQPPKLCFRCHLNPVSNRKAEDICKSCENELTR